jgi:hypothetical protein
MKSISVWYIINVCFHVNILQHKFSVEDLKIISFPDRNVVNYKLFEFAQNTMDYQASLYKIFHQDAPKNDNPQLEQPTLAKTHTT